uniref:Uncharacterized protein n=1 Tax=Corvus moneduloides TaxID=1196302 RepID=A0A8C3GYA9_CORMO
SAELEQCELEKAEQFPDEASSEASQIRQQLLSCRSEYNVVKGRVYENRLKVECLREEKKLLENEYERMLKEKKDDRIKQLKENCDELSKEVIQRKAEIDSIKEAVSSKEKLILTDEEEMEKLQETQTYLKAELVRILGVPKQLAKETEKLNQKKIDAEKKNEALNDQIEELNRTLKATERRIEEILQEREDVMKELDERQTLTANNKRECMTLTKLLEMSTEKELAVLSDRQILENNLNKCILENKKQQDILSHHQTQKDRELKHLKKLELQLKGICDSLERDKAKHKRLKSEVCMNALIIKIVNVLVRNTSMKSLDSPNRGKGGRLLFHLPHFPLALEEYAKIKKNERMTELIKKDYCKVEQEMLENKEKEKYLNVDRLTTIATHMEEEILQLRKKCERAIQQQNESGLLLREREEELGLLYEKVKRQEMLCRNGDIKTQVMDEKISFLKLKVAEKKREIKLFFKELPVRNALDAHLVRLQIQVGVKRSLFLLSFCILKFKLLQKEQRLLKIDFLCENISDLTDRIRAMVENGKQDMLLFTRKTNELQKKINDKTLEIRALFAELSMQQALAIKLQQEIRDKEQFVMTASLTISQGLPSPIEAEKKRWKIVHSEKMQKVAAEAREEQGAAPCHAPAIPEEGRLPLLQPHMAPLRPSEPSSSPRHFKKPPAKLPEI